MKFPYKVKVGNDIIPAWTEISDEALGVVKPTAPVVSAENVKVEEPAVPETKTKRGRPKK